MGTMTCDKFDMRVEKSNVEIAPPDSMPVGGSAFDQWLTHHLKQLYDPVVSEPLPPELLRLLSLRLD